MAAVLAAEATNIAPDTDGKRLDRVANRTRQKIDRPDQQAIDSVGLVDVARVRSDCAFGSVQGCSCGDDPCCHC
jgi:hypothetical protein